MSRTGARPELGVNTYGYIWSTPALACLRRLGELGYRSFELVVNPPHFPLDGWSAALRRDFGGTLARDGLCVPSLNLPSLDTNLASPLDRMRAYSVAVFRDVIDLAADLGIAQVVTVPGRLNPLLAPPRADRDAWLRESLDALVPHAERRGVGLALENVPFAALPDAASLGAFVRGYGSPALGVCYDAANAHFIGEAPADGLRGLRDLVRVVHLSDTTRTAWRHDEVGRGDVPFDGMADALDDIRFQGTCMLEIIDPQPEDAILRSHRALASRGFAPCPAGQAA
ncbi:sugar phosphate isomerase/epimerase family protein [Piscinibacter sp.]|uniref:sugar phosphate isomerase/epimerase family protein n=1 Tax=Piscinibacter sp. TaxID=1903157 RepID=UPI0039E67941